MKDYYMVSTKHCGSKDNSFELWAKNCSGYTRAIEHAGLYELKDDFENQKSMNIIFVHKDDIEKMKRKIRLPKYGDKEETYAGLNEFHVLPNTGQVRKQIGITTLDFSIQGNRDSFDAHFEDEVIEVFKYEYSKTRFRVKAKDTVNEFWFMDDIFEAENRNKAILKAFKYWMPDGYDSYINFKKDVLCSRERFKILSKWVRT